MNYSVVQIPPSHYMWMELHSPNRVTRDFVAIGAVGTSTVEKCEICGGMHPPIKGMVGYSDWTKNRCIMHFALVSPSAARSLREPAFKYVFEQAGRKYVLGYLRSDDKFRRGLARKLGFEEIYTLKDDVEDGVDMILLRYTREQWEKRHV